MAEARYTTGVVGRVRRAFSRVVALGRISPTPLHVAFVYGLSKISSRASSRQLCRFAPGGIELWARPQDWLGLDEVFTAGEYAFVGELLAGTRNPIVVDLGANIGAFAAYVLGCCPSAAVYSVEAAADTAELLKRNSASNPGFKWQAHHCALWTHDGHVEFAQAGISTGRRVQTNGTGVRVPSLTLPSLLNTLELQGDRISLLKIDIEGAEQRVLEQAGPWMNRVDYLIVEVHPPMSTREGVMNQLTCSFRTIREIPRLSTKPLMVASR